MGTNAIDESAVEAGLPGQIWAFWNIPAGRWMTSGFVAPGMPGQTFLWAMTEAEAVAAAENLSRLFQLDCVPVRVK